MAIKRRTVLASAAAGAALLAAPNIVRAQAQRELRFIPHADLASLDPVWTTADITRNHGNMNPSKPSFHSVRCMKTSAAGYQR
jgi:hypothetical protein